MPRPTSYLQRPLRFRRDRFVSLRWRVRTDPGGRGVFACRHALPDTRAWAAAGLDETHVQAHADVRFLSRAHADQAVIYHGILDTVEQAVGYWLEEDLHAELDGLLAAAGVPAAQAWPWQAPAPALDALAGTDGRPRSALAWLADRWAQVDADHWRRAPVRLGVGLDESFPLAVGLRAVLDEPTWTPDAVAGFVEAFWQSGEQPCPAPVDFDRAHARLAALVVAQRDLYRRISG